MNNNLWVYCGDTETSVLKNNSSFTENLIIFEIYLCENLVKISENYF